MDSQIVQIYKLGGIIPNPQGSDRKMRNWKWIYCVFIIKKKKRKNAKSIYLYCGELDVNHNVANPQHEVGLLCNSREKDQRNEQNIKTKSFLFYFLSFLLFII